jgi:hypothetical protein
VARTQPNVAASARDIRIVNADESTLIGRRDRVIAVGAAVAAVLLAVGWVAATGSGSTSAGVSPSLPPARSSLHALYGFAGPPPRLYAVDPRTLRPRRNRSAPVAGHAFGWSFSPSRDRLAAGSDATAELRLYDLRRLRVFGDIELVKPSVRGLVFASTWASRSRVLAVVVSPGCCGLGNTIVSGVNADTRRVLWRRDLHGSLQAGAAYRGGFLLVLGPRFAIGPSRLLVVAPDGSIRTARLDQIRSGWQRSGSGARFLAHQWNPGLAIDPATARAFVVQAAAPVAEINLHRLSVRYHGLSEPISLLGRLHNWVEPEAEAKAMQGPQRQAVWLGDGRFAVTGVDYEASVDNRGQEQETDTPAGLKLIDTRNWSVRTLDHTTSSIVYASGVLFAFGTSWDSRTSTMRGSGLTAFDSGGRELYDRYGDQPISGVNPVPRGVLIGGNQGTSVFRHQDLLQPRTGRVIGHAGVDIELVSKDQPFWF